MEEFEWLSSAEPGAMLDHLDGKLSERKLRLYGCACVRRYWGLLRWPVPREALAFAEAWAEAGVTPDDLAQMLERANASAADAPMFEQPAYLAAASLLADSAMEAARNAAGQIRQQAIREAAYEVPPGHDEQRITAAASAVEGRALADVLREVAGNPFRPVRIDPCWLHWGDGVVGSLARLFAEEGRHGELPYLADALQDAGCSDEELIRHLRRPAGHVRGCWALDVLLGNG